MTTEHKFETSAEVIAFMLAGNAIFTLRSQATGNRFTYKVVLADKKNPNDKNEVPAWFVNVLTGADNMTDYTYIGMIHGTDFHATKASKSMANAPCFVTFKWALTNFYRTIQSMPANLEVYHVGRCGRCGRVLTVPESIASGIGPDCAAQMGKEQVQLTLNAAKTEIPVDQPKRRTFAAAKAQVSAAVSTPVIIPSTEDIDKNWIEQKNKFAAREREQEAAAFLSDIPNLD